jgi:hypothetical protein
MQPLEGQLVRAKTNIEIKKSKKRWWKLLVLEHVESKMSTHDSIAPGPGSPNGFDRIQDYMAMAILTNSNRILVLGFFLITLDCSNEASIPCRDYRCCFTHSTWTYPCACLSNSLRLIRVVTKHMFRVFDAPYCLALKYY